MTSLAPDNFYSIWLVLLLLLRHIGRRDGKAGRAGLPLLFTQEPVVKEAWCLQEAAGSPS